MREIIFDDIKKANDTIATTTIERKDKKTGDVKTKEYAEVNQRVKAFRMVYPTGQIITDIISHENGIVVMKTTVGYFDGETFQVLGTGMARENENASYINQTSYIENCETSAVGRALGFAGFGIDTSICSAEELKNALAQQAQTPPQTKAQPQPQPKKEEKPFKAQRDKLAKIAGIVAKKDGKTVKDVIAQITQMCGVSEPKTEKEYEAMIDAAILLNDGLEE